MKPGTLRRCPECGGRWPDDADHALRSFRWLDDLPRGISVSNLDACIHDGGDGRNRFLVLETKREEEPWPPPSGESRLLAGLARLPNFTVRILRGTPEQIAVHKVSAAGIEGYGRFVSGQAFRAFVAEWLATGGRWEDIARARPDLMAEARRIFADDLVESR